MAMVCGVCKYLKANSFWRQLTCTGLDGRGGRAFLVYRSRMHETMIVFMLRYAYLIFSVRLGVISIINGVNYLTISSFTD